MKRSTPLDCFELPLKRRARADVGTRPACVPHAAAAETAEVGRVMACAHEHDPLAV